MNAGCDRGDKSTKQGFTLVEVLVALGLTGLVMAGVSTSVWMCQRHWRSAEMYLRVCYESGHALQTIVYGMEGRGGLREAESVTVTEDTNGWQLAYLDADGVPRRYAYRSFSDTLVGFLPEERVLCRDLARASAQTNGSGVLLRLEVRKRAGHRGWTNAVSTFVDLRNAQ